MPTPTSVVTQFVSDWRSGLYGRNVGQTLKEAATGYVVANALAIVLGVAFVQVPLVEKALLRIAIASYCLPIIAIGPILTFVLHGDAPQAALAGLLVFFPSLVGRGGRTALRRPPVTRPHPGLRRRVVDAADQGAPAGRPAERLLRASRSPPRPPSSAPSSASSSASRATGSGIMMIDAEQALNARPHLGDRPVLHPGRRRRSTW